jgi:trans-aconitate methyltransferase
MKRIVEPELMSEEEQAKAYAKADFEAAHSFYSTLFEEKFPRRPKRAFVLDLGCGPCDVTIRFAKANPGYTFHAVDGSGRCSSMGSAPLTASADWCVASGSLRVSFRARRFLADTTMSFFPAAFLHHLHDPQVLWQTVRNYGRRGTIVFVPDLRRPTSRVRARAMTQQYSGTEPEVLKRDFFNSLMAAFTPAEIRKQLKKGGLSGLAVETISDRHLLVLGRMR